VRLQIVGAEGCGKIEVPDGAQVQMQRAGGGSSVSFLQNVDRLHVQQTRSSSYFGVICSFHVQMSALSMIVSTRARMLLA
jgi:hypothetical protein